MSANPQQGGFSGGTAEVLNFAVSTAIQLLGEEVLVILPFLALMWVSVNRMGWSRKRAILLSWVLTAVWFGAAHLPTYDWNVAQALLDHRHVPDRLDRCLHQDEEHLGIDGGTRPERLDLVRNDGSGGRRRAAAPDIASRNDRIGEAAWVWRPRTDSNRRRRP